MRSWDSMGTIVTTTEAVRFMMDSSLPSARSSSSSPVVGAPLAQAKVNHRPHYCEAQSQRRHHENGTDRFQQRHPGTKDRPCNVRDAEIRHVDLLDTPDGGCFGPNGGAEDPPYPSLLLLPNAAPRFNRVDGGLIFLVAFRTFEASR